jgi:N-acyl-D-amino-acid deacylase
MIDVLIKNGEVIDGTGKPSYKANVAIKKDQVVDIGVPEDIEAYKTINAAGKIVAPGFIDVHSHNDLYVRRRSLGKVFEPFIRQGITTVVTGNCGEGIAPFPAQKNRELFLKFVNSKGVPLENAQAIEWSGMDEFLTYVEKKGSVTNMAHLVPHGPIRVAVMGEESRYATAAEIEEMKALLEEAMEAGCYGFSTGLTYYPGMYSHTDELAALNQVCGRYNGRYATHIRSQCITFPWAVQEAVDIARQGQTGLQISHFHAKPFFGKYAGLFQKVIKLIEGINRSVPLPGFPNEALQEGLAVVNRELTSGMDIGLDMTLYMMANTTLTVVFPPWAQIGGVEKLIERLSDENSWKEIKQDMQTVKPCLPLLDAKSWSNNFSRALGWGVIKVLSVNSEKNRSLEGKCILDIARERGKDPWQTARELTIEENGAVYILAGYPSRPWTEKAFSALFKHPQMSVMCDGLIPEFGLPLQAVYGTFPRFLGHYVRELKLLPLEEAVYKCTGLSASRYDLKHRGELLKGNFADIVIFDPHTIEDLSATDDPARYPKGVETVVINGKVVLEGDHYDQDANAGRVLRKS